MCWVRIENRAVMGSQVWDLTSHNIRPKEPLEFCFPMDGCDSFERRDDAP